MLVLVGMIGFRVMEPEEPHDDMIDDEEHARLINDSRPMGIDWTPKQKRPSENAINI